MQLIRNLQEIERPLIRPVLTIGNFDGVHEGHRVLFQRVRERAQELKGQSVVMTFEPHPIKVMKPGNGPPLITLTEQKLELIGKAAIDVILCLPFTPEFAAISARDFVEDILVRRIGIREIVVGYDYSFGAGREGNITLLRRMGAELGFDVQVLGPITIDDVPVSSTAIRNLVQEGDLPAARRLLGRNYRMYGTVVQGKGRGASLLGFPTANLNPIDELVPKEGVYAVLVEVDDRTYQGLTNIGKNPTFKNNALSIETHLLDFSGDLVGKSIRIEFLERLRNEKAFKSVQELADQIGRDIEQARAVFGTDERRNWVGSGL
ncbi:MAG: bifunctional riboflavin kinase/FAD synthetase [Desulfobacteraceae bacterium]|jgi:riboflavin kinase/FMN adenylyltransferase